MMIDLLSTQALFSHISFLFLLLLMICYWAGAIFSWPKKYSIIGTYIMGLVNLSLIAVLILRWVKNGHYPLSNLYESLLFLGWSITTLHLILEKMTSFPFLGTVTTPLALFLLGFATFSLPLDLQGSQALVPALQSHWLLMHVTTMLISYAALLAGSLFAIAFLVLGLESKIATSQIIDEYNNLEIKTDNFQQSTSTIAGRLKEFENKQKPITQGLLNFVAIDSLFDQLSYRTLSIGFAFLTVGILSGAVWANEAWGSYWSWDPKETWALITWIVFALYLHLRIIKGWSGKKPAIMASIGFVVIWICYLGVNLLGKGLHSYGWLTS